jgi:hypothetical protein
LHGEETFNRPFLIPKGSREDIVGASLQQSYLWPQVQVMHLTENMRVERNDPQSTAFAEWLLSVGEGRNLNEEDNKIPIPPNMICQGGVQGLIDEIYPNIGTTTQHLPDDYFLDRAILASRNAEVAELNTSIFEKMAGEPKIFNSIDSVGETHGVEEDGMDHTFYTTEFLNTINIGGLPPSKLEIKQGVPLMLLRNLDPQQGLCNGTRLRHIRSTTRVLQVRILTGPGKGNIAFIPRITLTSKEAELDFELRRRQFPVRLGFVMTINKSQGQSVGTVGLYLSTPVFTHGQLYVGLSRATNGNRIKVLLEEDNTDGKTVNIVYPEVILKR